MQPVEFASFALAPPVALETQKHARRPAVDALRNAGLEANGVAPLPPRAQTPATAVDGNGAPALPPQFWARLATTQRDAPALASPLLILLNSAAAGLPLLLDLVIGN